MPLILSSLTQSVICVQPKTTRWRHNLPSSSPCSMQIEQSRQRAVLRPQKVRGGAFRGVWINMAVNNNKKSKTQNKRLMFFFFKRILSMQGKGCKRSVGVLGCVLSFGFFFAYNARLLTATERGDTFHVASSCAGRYSNVKTGPPREPERGRKSIKWTDRWGADEINRFSMFAARCNPIVFGVFGVGLRPEAKCCVRFYDEAAKDSHTHTHWQTLSASSIWCAN